MNGPKQIAVFVVLALLVVACGASRQPAHPSTPAAAPEGDLATPATPHEELDTVAPLAADDAAAVPPSQDLLEAERATYERARPVFEEHCSRCHTSDGKRAKPGALKHFNMDKYPLGGHHATDIAATIREVLGVGGEEATMPKDKPGAVQGEQLSLVTAWADAYDRAHAAGAHAGAAEHEPHSDEDMHEHEHSDGAHAR